MPINNEIAVTWIGLLKTLLLVMKNVNNIWLLKCFLPIKEYCCIFWQDLNLEIQVENLRSIVKTQIMVNSKLSKHLNRKHYS